MRPEPGRVDSVTTRRTRVGSSAPNYADAASPRSSPNHPGRSLTANDMDPRVVGHRPSTPLMTRAATSSNVDSRPNNGEAGPPATINWPSSTAAKQSSEQSPLEFWLPYLSD